MSLKDYRRKRNFARTPEPVGKAPKKPKGWPRFVVQMHSATRLHFDFRLEFGGVFKSWAVPKGPSLNPLDQRLAVFVEDHPLAYGSFEGIIPKGNYGAGTVLIWDEGTYLERNSKDRRATEAAMKKGLDKGHLTFVLHGQKLKGEFALIQLKKNTRERAWLLVKKRDAHSSYKRDQILAAESVKTGRSLEEIASKSEQAGDIWLPKRKKESERTTRRALPTAKKAKSRALEPMPRKNRPMQATLARSSPPSDWLMDPDPEGLRAMAEVDGGRVHLYSKAGLPFEKKFPDVISELKELNLHAVLDGEIVKTKTRSIYYVFDLLYHHGHDLRKKSLQQRRQILEKFLPSGRNVRPISALKRTDAKQVVAKDPLSLYRSGTTSDWLIVPRTLSTKSRSALRTPNDRRRVRPRTKIAAAKSKSSGARKLVAPTDEPRLTNLDKIYWPEEQITKGDLLEYYREVAPYILPYLKDRPESLNRHPNGIAAPGFYQKDMTGHQPRWFKTVRLFSESADKSIDYALCQDLRSLLYIVNLGCIEINPWFSRLGHLNEPDFLVIDLDPDGNDFKHVIQIAHEFHTLLTAVGATSFCKTSGATGLHIGVPTGARYDFDQVRAFAEMACRVVVKKYPATTSIDRNPSRRRRKIYLDFMQNRRGQTLAAPYCLRPRPGAPVSMPVTWEELRSGLKPEQFNIQNALGRIKKGKDPWAGVLGRPIHLDRCIAALQRKFMKA